MVIVKKTPVSDGSDCEKEQLILKRLLSTPPNHKTKPKPDANPKKKGRPPKVKSEHENG